MPRPMQLVYKHLGGSNKQLAYQYSGRSNKQLVYLHLGRSDDSRPGWRDLSSQARVL